jgi:prepilin-type N-terminal cleavage/methylation domain-containing protein
MTSRTDRRGFTLLEAVVALGITALVLAALYGAVTRGAMARERVSARAERLAAGRAALVQLTDEVEAALAPRDPAGPERFVVSAAPEPGPAWSALRFVTMAGARSARAVAYRIEQGTLVRREASRFAPPDTPEPPGRPLLTGVRTFQVRCFDGAVWRTAWTIGVLPVAIEVTLATDDDADLSTTVTLPLGMRS